jgi:hypothetical protein
MLLDGPYNNSLSCLAIASQTALSLLFGFGFLLAFAVLGTAMRYSVAPDQAAWRAKNRKPLSLLFLVFLPLVFLLLSFEALGTRHSRKQLFVAGPSLVETGCIWLTEYRQELPLTVLDLSYDHSDVRGSHDYLIISGGGRILTVDLQRSPHLKNLSLFAPTAMKQYAGHLRNKGLPVPPAFDDIQL